MEKTITLSDQARYTANALRRMAVALSPQAANDCQTPHVIHALLSHADDLDRAVNLVFYAASR